LLGLLGLRILEACGAGVGDRMLERLSYHCRAVPAEAELRGKG
jgi:hypothetical protein